MEKISHLSNYADVSNRRRGQEFWIIIFLLGACTFALYWPVHRFDFVDYDDPEYIVREPVVRNGLSWWGLAWAFVDQHASNWHPLTWISHMLDCQCFGLTPGGPHVINALLHCANAVLVFVVFRKMTGAVWRSAFVAAIFAWHPLRVESVAWISERKDVLSGLFFMLTLWAYTRFAEDSLRLQPEDPKRRKWLKVALVCFALGLLSKPMLVTVPFVLLLLDVWPLRRVPEHELRMSTIWRSKTFRALLFEKIPFFALSIILSVITVLAQKAGNAVIPMKSLGFGSRIAFALSGYLAYLEKIFWPHDMSVLYLRPTNTPWAEAAVALAILIGIAFSAIANFRRHPYLLIGYLWFVGMLVPVSNLVQVGLQSIADRYTYLPSLGLAMMLVWGVSELSTHVFAEKPRKILLSATAFVLLVACVGVTHHQLGYWRNTRTLMEHALEIDPNNFVADENLIVFFSRVGDHENTELHYKRAQKLHERLSSTTLPHPAGSK